MKRALIFWVIFVKLYTAAGKSVDKSKFCWISFLIHVITTAAVLLIKKISMNEFKLTTNNYICTNGFERIQYRGRQEASDRLRVN